MTFKIVCNWLPDPGEAEASGPERSTWARISLWARGECLTSIHPAELSPSATESDRCSVEGGASGVVEWIVDNWTEIFWETRLPFAMSELPTPKAFPSLRDAERSWVDFTDDSSDLSSIASWQQHHTLGVSTSDLALPSIVFVPETRRVVVQVDYPARLDATVRFSPSEPNCLWPRIYVFAKEEIMEAFGGLIEATLERARANQHSERWSNWLSEKWQKSRARSEDQQVRLRLAVGDWVANRWDRITADNRDIARALTSVLMDSSLVSSEDVLSHLVTAFARGRSTNPAWENINPPSFSSEVPLFEQGYQMARYVRKTALNNTADPIVNLREAFGARLGVFVEDPKESLPFRTGVFARPGFDASILSSASDPRMNGVAGARFALAAVLGRLVFEASNGNRRAIGAAHSPWSQWSEARRANAFAAELLLPSHGLKSRGSKLDLDALCDEYGISRTAARWHARNCGYQVAADQLERETLYY